MFGVAIDHARYKSHWQIDRAVLQLNQAASLNQAVLQRGWERREFTHMDQSSVYALVAMYGKATPRACRVKPATGYEPAL